MNHNEKAQFIFDQAQHGIARALFEASRLDTGGRFPAGKHLCQLLPAARATGSPFLHGYLLRAILIEAQLAGNTDRVSLAKEELERLVAHHTLPLLSAALHASSSHAELRTGNQGGCLDHAAEGLALLDNEPDATMRAAAEEREAFAGADKWRGLLIEVSLEHAHALGKLGLHRLSHELMVQTQAQGGRSGSYETSLYLLHRVGLLLSWALRLERADHHRQAREHYATAARLVRDADAPWQGSPFAGDAGLPAVEQSPLFAAAAAMDATAALGRSGRAPPIASAPEVHVERLQRLRRSVTHPLAQVISAIALGRALMLADTSDQAREQAVAVLRDCKRAMQHQTGETALLLYLLRELHRYQDEPGEGAEAYITGLEAELWSMREARIAGWAARLEHLRLTREHGQIARQALLDPLTGLPNRRALHESLQRLTADLPHRGLVIALIDLDRFKDVNDRASHLVGDDVLRRIATSARDALRSDDIIARYGGDEFVVLLPELGRHDATAVLRRAADAVRGLAPEVSRGVTLSVGLATALPAEDSAALLARADAAMYEAKRRGGDRVLWDVELQGEL